MIASLEGSAHGTFQTQPDRITGFFGGCFFFLFSWFLFRTERASRAAMGKLLRTGWMDGRGRGHWRWRLDVYRVRPS